VKFISTILALFVLLQASSASAVIIGFKDWSFIQTLENWNDLNTSYDSNGVCIASGCGDTIWASSSELAEMLRTANLDSLVTDGLPLPKLLGQRPSICYDDDSYCVWTGWLRDEDPIDFDLALSFFVLVECDFLGRCGAAQSQFASFDKTFADEGASGGIAITGHWAYTHVNTPSTITLFALGLFTMLFVRKTSNLRLINTFFGYRRQS